MPLAGTILGVESVPDGLAIGLLAGVNPVAGIYAFLFGMAGAALATSSTFMAVQATGAMALIVSDTDLATRPDPDRALFTLAMLTGVVHDHRGRAQGRPDAALRADRRDGGLRDRGRRQHRARPARRT